MNIGSGDKGKSLSVKEHLNMIRPYLSDIINDYITQREWRIYLTMAMNFFSSKNTEEICTMYSKTDDIEVMMGNETDETIEDFFYSFLQKDYKNLKESMRGSEFVFDSVD